MIADRVGQQLEALRTVVATALAADGFTARRLRKAGLSDVSALTSLEDFARVPMLTRDDLVRDQASHPPFGTNLTGDLSAYVRASRTAGRAGDARLVWLDRSTDLEWVRGLWQTAFDGIGITRADVVLDLFGLPTALDVLTVPGDGSVADLTTFAPTVVVARPADALRLATLVAAHDGMDLSVRLVVLIGAPGANVPSTRRRIEDAFSARCADLYASVETGAVGWQCPAFADGLHLNETAFIVESAAVGELSELVLTSLGRTGMPLLRYRTGDLVRLSAAACECGSSNVIAAGGILGRVAEVLVVRGHTVLPSDLENVVRRHPAVTYFELHRFLVHGQCELSIDVEPDGAVASEGDRARVAAEVAADIRRSLGLLLQCEAVPPGSIAR